MEAHFCHVSKERSDTLEDHNYDKKFAITRCQIIIYEIK